MLAYLLGTALGITLSSTIHGLAIAPVFLVLASLHLTASFRSLSHLEFDTMNQQRVAILLHHHLSKLPIPTPAEVASDHERIVKRPESEATRPVHLGATLTDAFKDQAAFFDSLVLPCDFFLLSSLPADLCSHPLPPFPPRSTTRWAPTSTGRRGSKRRSSSCLYPRPPPESPARGGPPLPRGSRRGVTMARGLLPFLPRKP